MRIITGLTFKTAALTLGLCLVAVGAVSVAGYLKSSEALLRSQAQGLEAVRSNRATAIERYFDSIIGQIETQSVSPDIAGALTDLTRGFDRLPADAARAVGGLDGAAGDVEAYYTNEFRPRLQDAGGKWTSASQYLPAEEAGVIAQSIYIANNPNPVGSKLELTSSDVDSAYNQSHESYHPFLRTFLERFGYYDIFLVSPSGQCVYTVFKEADFATNLFTGPYADTGLGQVCQKAWSLNSPGSWAIEDFAPYAPSYNAPASFIAAPVFDNGEKIGVIAFQMPVGKIAEIMSDEAGLGETGDTLLIGPDNLSRSSSRFLDSSAILAARFDDENLADVRGGKSTWNRRTQDGKEFLAAYQPLEIEGLDWVIVAQAQIDEVLAPARQLAATSAFIAAVVAAVAAIGSVVFARSLVRRVAVIKNAIVKIVESRGDLTVRVESRSRDELGELSRYFNAFVLTLHDIVRDLAAESKTVVEAAVAVRDSASQSADGIGKQHQQTEQIAAAIEELSATIQSVGQKSAEAAEVAANAGQGAVHGGSVVEETTQRICTIAELVQRGSDEILRLGKRSEEIGEIKKVINEIADQTNLLALNAAIEAARAGEHGRGFAVVADEVRKLAERTTKATQEVGNSILQIQSETRQVVQIMQDGKDSVTDGVEKARSAGETLEGIVENSKAVASAIGSIASATTEQTTASQQIAQSVEHITQFARTSSQLAGDAHEAALKIEASSQAIGASLGAFRLEGDAKSTGSVEAFAAVLERLKA